MRKACVSDRHDQHVTISAPEEHRSFLLLPAPYKPAILRGALVPPRFLGLMSVGVARGAQRNQILFRIVAGLAAKPFVVNFQSRHRATRLAPPAIAAKHLLS